jgi:hypothetical protein
LSTNIAQPSMAFTPPVGTSLSGPPAAYALSTSAYLRLPDVR